MGHVLDVLPRAWWSVELPGFRPHPDVATYSRFPFESLPGIDCALDAEWTWLRGQPVRDEDTIADNGGGWPAVTLSAVQERAKGLDPAPPDEFLSFFEPSWRLTSRVRSCTWCGLSLGERVVPATTGGWLMPFLADSQGVLFWSLLRGDRYAAVLASQVPFGYEEPSDQFWDPAPLREFDPASGLGWIVAESFPEFMYRFWIENEIWFRSQDEQGLTDEMRRYAERSTG